MAGRKAPFVRRAEFAGILGSKWRRIGNPDPTFSVFCLVVAQPAGGAVNEGISI
jgi:hypothetical protein